MVLGTWATLPGKARARHMGLYAQHLVFIKQRWKDNTKRIHSPPQGSMHFSRSRNYFISHVRSPMWKFGLNSNMVPIYSIDVLRLVTDGPPACLPSLTPKPGLGICFQVCYLKNVGVLKRIYNFRKSYPRPAYKKAYHANIPKSNVLNLSAWASRGTLEWRPKDKGTDVRRKHQQAAWAE